MKRISHKIYHDTIFSKETLMDFNENEMALLRSHIIIFSAIEHLTVHLFNNRLSFNFTSTINHIVVDICDLHFYKFTNNIFSMSYYNYKTGTFTYYLLDNIEDIRSSKMYYIHKELLSDPNIILHERNFNLMQILAD